MSSTETRAGTRAFSTSGMPPSSRPRPMFSVSASVMRQVESRCGAVALGRTYLLPPLSFGGASMVPPWLRFHIPLIEPDTGRFPASGLYGAFFVKGASRHFGRPLHSILLFDPRRELLPSRPHISIAVARSGGQGRRFFSAAEGLSLTDASTAAGCRRSGGWPRDDPRGACHWPRSIARTTLVFG